MTVYEVNTSKLAEKIKEAGERPRVTTPPLNSYAWHEVTENDNGIETMALENKEFPRVVGYNGILKGEKVWYKGNVYTVVMVSRLGHIGLSETGSLPYTEVAMPNELTKHQEEGLKDEVESSSN